MVTQIITLAILIMTAAIGIWKYFSRMKSERRRLADEAKAKLGKAQTPSDFLDSFDSMRRM
jgi:membrane protein implicated in regulation of membrane protease activity